MRVEKFVYIKGLRKKQLEIVDFVANDEPTGFRNTYTKTLRNNVKHIRANVYFCNHIIKDLVFITTLFIRTTRKQLPHHCTDFAINR